MPRISVSGIAIVVALGVLLFPALMTSQGGGIGTIEVEDINNCPAAARKVLRSVGTRAPDQASIRVTPITIPAGTAVGTYYLFARADGANLLVERQEGNNSAIRSFTIGRDLIVSITLGPWPTVAGIRALVRDTATNRGGGEGPSVVTSGRS